MPILSWKNTKNPHTFRCLAAGIFVVWAGALVAITFIYPQPVVITDENLEKFREITQNLSDSEIEEIARGGEYRHKDYTTS